MTQARRAATRTTLQSLRQAVRPRSQAHHPTRALDDSYDLLRAADADRVHTPTRAMVDPEALVEASATRRLPRMVLPGVAAALAVAGTAVAVTQGSEKTLEATPAAVDMSARTTDRPTRNDERPTPQAQTPTAEPATPAAETPSASAMAQAAPSFTPSPKPEPEPEPTETATAKTSPTATSSASEKSSASAESSTAKATGSIANCNPPSGGAIAANTQKVWEASCLNFPDVTTYGGTRAGDPGNHGTGHALDIMVSGARGQEIANYMRAHASELGITEVIYQQKIWTTQRSSEGWRAMSDRGSATQNHMDHVHVSTS